MGWYEQSIRRYEHRRWTVDDNRRVFPFSWGLEHIGGPADPAATDDPRAFLDHWTAETLSHSDNFYAASPASDYDLSPDGLLTFSSAHPSPWPENNIVHARLFRAKHSGPAVVVLPHWNAKPQAYVTLARWLNTLGITALRLSLPYHDRRAIPGHERADHLVGPNIGLTIAANRQAVTDARRAVQWLASQGYDRIGILGTSIGSSVGFITLAHEPFLRAGAFLHVSTYFADVVSTGMTTMHVWEGLRAKVSLDELRRWWAPISPFPYVGRFRSNGKRTLLVSARYDPTFWPEYSQQLFDALHSNGVEHEKLLLPCGHYSIELPPFNIAAGGRLGFFFFHALA